MQSPPFPRYLVLPRSKYSPQHHVLKDPQLPFLPQCQRPSFTQYPSNLIMNRMYENQNLLYIVPFSRLNIFLNVPCHCEIKTLFFPYFPFKVFAQRSDISLYIISSSAVIKGTVAGSELQGDSFIMWRTYATVVKKLSDVTWSLIDTTALSLNICIYSGTYCTKTSWPFRGKLNSVSSLFTRMFCTSQACLKSKELQGMADDKRNTLYITYTVSWWDLTVTEGRDSSVGIATRYGLDCFRGSNPCGEGDFPHPSRPALGPTQPPIQWVPGLSLG